MSDPLGAAIKAYWEGNKKAVIQVYTDQADPDELPVHYLFRKEEEMPEREQFALSLCRGRVLDVGAGAGSHAVALQQKGLEVTALEISEKAAQVQKARGVQQVVVGDMFQMPPTPSFDTVLLLMNGIGIAGTLEQLPQFLDICKRWLAPGGQILLESSDILYLYEEEDGSVLLDLNGAYYGELTYVMEYRQERSQPFDWLFIDYSLLEQYAQEADLKAELLLQEEDAHYLARLTVA
ncbi:class I SAM-dependent methyltransferase [Rufibacter quisquiliarum]|uniref:SAM-dependent methyltransferase n=1 Tax=Rufibacter quisquiliarum TaxID=1549639 RepID=A0A839GXL5_9BACT|nr:class I SAM-dependent methyltransferase [Rufibacter quisquiliarum]MBA9079466.1 SAM-dependent methyltransferase [Rufibacter quisquiliarum]